MQWRDRIEIGPQCFEKVLAPDNLTGLAQHGFRTGGVIETAGHYRVSRIDAGVHVLLFTIKGQGHLRTAAAGYNLEANSIAVIPAGNSFEFRLLENSWQLAWLLLSPEFLWPLEYADTVSVVESHSASRVHTLMHCIYEESLYSEANANDDLLVRLQSLIYNVLTQTVCRPEAKDKPQFLVHNVFRRVSQQLHISWSVASMAALACVSEPHFYRLCQQVLGQSPHQYLIQLRLQRAAQYLHISHWPVSDIAQRVGYGDALHFSQAFKREYGLSPSSYRTAKVLK